MTQEREWWISLFSSLFHICINLPHCPVWFGPPLLVEPEQCAADLVESEGHRWMMTSLKCKLHRGDESRYLQSSVFFHTSHHFFPQFICILWLIVLRNQPGRVLIAELQLYSIPPCTLHAGVFGRFGTVFLQNFECFSVVGGMICSVPSPPLLLLNGRGAIKVMKGLYLLTKKRQKWARFRVKAHRNEQFISHKWIHRIYSKVQC